MAGVFALGVVLSTASAQPRQPSAAPRVVDRLLEAFPRARGWFRMVASLELHRDPEGRLVPAYESLTHHRVRQADAAGMRVLPALPLRFRSAMRIASSWSPSIWVDLTPLDARDARATVENGLVVYAGAFADTDVLYKATPTHLDEYLLVGSARAPSRWRYRVRTGPGVGGVRQAGNAIEVLDRNGTPRLRAAAPFAVDARSVRAFGRIRLDGDVIVASIDLRELTFPVLVDPDWSSTGDMAFGRFYHQAAVLPDGDLLVTGGCSASICSGDLTLPSCREVVTAGETLDVATGVFARAGESAYPRFFHVMQALRDGTVLVAGGCVTRGCDATAFSAETWSSATRTFTPAGDLAEARGGMASALLADGRVLVAGGCWLDGCTAAAEVFDPMRRTFSAVSSLARARGRASVVALLDGRIAVIGGCTTIQCANVLADAEIYDPISDRWTTTAPMSVPRAAHWAERLADGRVMVGGGCTDQACTAVERSTEVLDPAALTFSPGVSMLQARAGAASTRLPDGNLLVSQGCGTRTGCDLTNEVYDVAHDVFELVEPSVTQRAFHVTVLHPSARLVIANGGCTPSTCSWWNETWDVSRLRPPQPDGGTPERDAGPDDSGTPRDAGPRPHHDAGAFPPLPGTAAADGCGCRLVGGSTGGGVGAAMAWVILLWVVRRRRVSGRRRNGA